MDARTDRRATLLWGLGFTTAYLVLAVVVSLLSGHHLHLAAWLPAPLLWLAGAVLDSGLHVFQGGLNAPRAPSPGRPARVAALRWVLCLVILVNAALLLWRAVQPGDSTLLVAGFGVRLLPLDVRLNPSGLDPLALALGLGLGFLGLCELRLRLGPGAPPSMSAA
jgi:hypothetical protein